jgi:hypothetical protein
MTDERASFEAEELRGLASEYGARREVVNGVGAWRFPAYVCAHCGPGVAPPLPDCPDPLAAHHADDDVGRAHALNSYALVWWYHGRRQRTQYTTLPYAIAEAQRMASERSGSPDYVIHQGVIAWRHGPIPGDKE